MLKSQQYLACEKTDGTRHLLACPPGSKEAFLVDRTFEIKDTLVIAGFPKDTLLDGELVNCKDGKILFAIYDAVRVKGEDLCSQSLTVRLAKAQSVVRGLIKSKKDRIELCVKNMIPLETLDALPPLDQFPYETDGLVLTPVNEPIRMGTHETMFKWKPYERITIDFSIKNGRELYIQEKGLEYKEAELWTASQPYRDGTIVECKYGERGWEVEKVRTDKTHPNNRRTYFRTCINLRENITLAELVRICTTPCSTSR